MRKFWDDDNKQFLEKYRKGVNNRENLEPKKEELELNDEGLELKREELYKLIFI